MRTFLIAVVGLMVAMPGVASAAVCGDPPYEEHCIINNGLAPPTPENVIDDDTFVDSYAYVRSVDCPLGWPASSRAWDDCPSPGAPTEAALTDGGEVGQDLRIYDSSSITVNGGTVQGYLLANNSSIVTINGGEMEGLNAFDSSTVTMSGGFVGSYLRARSSSTVTMSGGWVRSFRAQDSSTVTMTGGTARTLIAYGSSTVTMTGGTLAWELAAFDSSTITIFGGDFAVDGSPVPYGDLSALTGTLTGTLTSGDLIDHSFFQGGGLYTGTITLVEAPASVPPLIANGLAPPNPDNVIDDATYSGGLYVRNVDCPASAADCASPGAATQVALLDGAEVARLYVRESSSVAMSGVAVDYNVDAHESSSVAMSGGAVGWDLVAYDTSTVTMSGEAVVDGLSAQDSSTITMNGGTVVDDFSAYGSSTVTMNGGTVVDDFSAQDSSTVTMNGGTVGGKLVAWDATITLTGGTVGSHLSAEGDRAARITIEGSSFAVNGAPVPYGDLATQTGTLTGTLASGDPISNVFYQGGYMGQPCARDCIGTITLVPPPVDIDIKPRSDTNPINPFARGIIPVAILGSDDFNVADVDVTALAFGPNGAAPVHAAGGHARDVNDDGLMDLLSHYRMQDTGIAMGDTEACVTGETLDGVPLEGCDHINTQPPGQCGIGFELVLALPLLVWLRKRRRSCST